MSWKLAGQIKQLREAPGSGRRLTPGQKLVALVLADYYNDEVGAAWASVKRLVQDTGLTRRGVQLALTALVDGGVLAKTERFREDGGRTTSAYSFPVFDAQQATSPAILVRPPGEVNAPPGEVTAHHEPLREPLRELLTTETIARARGKELCDWRGWSDVPEPVGKRLAEKYSDRFVRVGHTIESHIDDALNGLSVRGQPYRHGWEDWERGLSRWLRVELEGDSTGRIGLEAAHTRQHQERSNGHQIHRAPPSSNLDDWKVPWHPDEGTPLPDGAWLGKYGVTVYRPPELIGERDR